MQKKDEEDKNSTNIPITNRNEESSQIEESSTVRKSDIKLKEPLSLNKIFKERAINFEIEMYDIKGSKKEQEYRTSVSFQVYPGPYYNGQIVIKNKKLSLIKLSKDPKTEPKTIVNLNFDLITIRQAINKKRNEIVLVVLGAPTKFFAIVFPNETLFSTFFYYSKLFRKFRFLIKRK